MSLLVACALRRPIPYTRAVRNLWTTATSSSSSLDKALNACTAALHKSKQSPRKQSQLCVVLASAHYPAASLEHLGRAVSDQFAPKCLIGAVVDSVAGTEGSSLGPGLSITLMDNDAKAECVGFMVNSDNVRHVKQKAVGRWPDMGRGFGIKGRDTDAEAFDLERFTTVSMGGGNVELPEKLQRILPSSEETALLLTFSDKEPYQFLETLDHSFPKATKIGLMGTMTPFVNGRPHTLYYNDKVLSGGLVGAAFVSKTLKASEKVSFAGLEALGEPLTITSCRGNIILNIDDTNAAKELLARMNNREMTAGIAAERQLYVRVSRGETSAVYRLTGGDPSKGTLAVDTIKDLEIGMQIQFMQHMGAKASTNTMQGKALVFTCTDPDMPTQASTDSQTPSAHISSTLSAASEGGFFSGHAMDQTGALNALTGSLPCDVPYSRVAVTFKESNRQAPRSARHFSTWSPSHALKTNLPNPPAIPKPTAPVNPLTAGRDGEDSLSTSVAFIYEDADSLGKLPDPALSLPGTKKTLKLRALIYDGEGILQEPVEGEFSKIGICKAHSLQPRDLRKMDNTYSEQTPIILVREKAILINLLQFKVLVKADMTILASKMGSDPYSPAFVQELGGKLKMKEGHYEFRALETVFLNVIAQLHAEQQAIFLRVNGTLKTLDDRIEEAELKGLLISRRKLDEFAVKVNSIRACFTAILNQDDDLAAMYLTDKARGRPRAISDHMEAELLFEHYLNLSDEVANATTQLSSNIAATQDIINIVLGSRRNQLIHYELMANLSMAAIAPAALMAGLFGMNIANGLEQDMHLFWGIFGGTFVVTGTVWFASVKKMWTMALAGGYRRQAPVKGSK